MPKKLTFKPVVLLSLLALLAVPARAELNSRNLDAPEGEGPDGAGLDAWTFNVEVVNGCYAVTTGTVTATGGGTQGAALTTYDDGVLIDYLEFTFPANGIAQPYCWVYQQVGEPAGGSIAIALRDTVGDPDAYDFSNFDISGVCTGPAPSCPQTWVDVPAVSPAGLGLLALGLAALALVGLRRRQRA